jgi:hypothetical protein
MLGCNFVHCNNKGLWPSALILIGNATLVVSKHVLLRHSTCNKHPTMINALALGYLSAVQVPQQAWQGTSAHKITTPIHTHTTVCL